MTVATGQNAKAAIAIETAVFGSTVIACGANSLLPLKSVNINPVKRYATRPVLDGHGGQALQDNIGITCAGTLECWGYYDNQALLLLQMMALGFSHQSNSPQNPTGSVYTHFIECDKDLDRRAWEQHEMDTPSGNAVRHFTLCIDKQISPIEEFLSCKVNGLTIKGDAADGRVVFIFDIVAHSRDLGSATNTTSASWTGNLAQPILFNDLTVRMRPVDEYTIAAANDVLQIVEDTAAADGGPDDVDIDVPDETYSGPDLAMEIGKLATAGSSHSIIHRGKYYPRNHKFENKNTNNALLLEIDTSDSQLHDTIGFYDDPTAALTLVSQLGGEFDNADLDTNDIVSISEFAIVIANNLETDHQDTVSGLYVVNPLRNNKRAVSFTAMLPRYTNTNLKMHVDNDTIMCADFRFLGASISGGEYYQHNVLIPQFKITNAPSPVTGPGIMPENISCMASLPLRDKIPGWDENAAASDSEIDRYLSTSEFTPTSAEDYVFSLKKYNGELYAGTGNTSAILHKKSSDGTWTEAFKDFTDYKLVESMVVFEEKLYCACQNDADTETHIFSYDGTTYTDEETFAGVAVVDMIEFNGLLIVALSDGDIYSSSDGSVYTQRETGNFSVMRDLCIVGNILYALGSNGVNGLIRKSANGTTWAAFHTGSDGDTNGYLWGVDLDGWLVAMRRLNGAFHKFDPDGTKTIIGDATNSFSYPGILFNGLIYWSDGNNDLYAFDGHNINSMIKIVSLDTIFTTGFVYGFETYQNRLYMGTDDGAGDEQIIVLRPLQEIQLEVQNGISSNPL